MTFVTKMEKRIYWEKVCDDQQGLFDYIEKNWYEPHKHYNVNWMC